MLLNFVTVVHGPTNGAALPLELRKSVAMVVPNLESMRLYRGRGGEVMRGAACRLLEVCRPNPNPNPNPNPDPDPDPNPNRRRTLVAAASSDSAVSAGTCRA